MTARVQRSGARAPRGGKMAVRSSPMKGKKGAPNFWDPENAAPKRLDGAEDVKDADNTGVDVDFEAGRRWLAEGERDEGRRARYLTPQRADAEAFDTPVRPTGARAKADPTNGVADVSLAAIMQQLTRLQDEVKRSNDEVKRANDEMKRSYDEMKLDVAELKLQRNDHNSVKAGPEANEELIRRLSHGMVDNMVHRLSQSTTASRELVNNPVIDYVPDASNEKGVREDSSHASSTDQSTSAWRTVWATGNRDSGGQTYLPRCLTESMRSRV